MFTEWGQNVKGQGHKPRWQGRKRPNGKAVPCKRPLIVIEQHESCIVNKQIGVADSKYVIIFTPYAQVTWFQNRKYQKGWYYLSAHWLFGDVLLSNITLFDICGFSGVMQWRSSLQDVLNGFSFFTIITSKYHLCRWTAQHSMFAEILSIVSWNSTATERMCHVPCYDQRTHSKLCCVWWVYSIDGTSHGASIIPGTIIKIKWLYWQHTRRPIFLCLKFGIKFQSGLSLFIGLRKIPYENSVG